MSHNDKNAFYCRIHNCFSPYQRVFVSTCIIGILIHMYKFTNTLPNYDSLFNYYNHQNIVASGRWFLMFACMPSSFFDLPWVIGVLSVFYIALTDVVVAALFNIKNPLSQVLTAGLIISFPAITETFFFEYTADGYMLAMLLAALSVYLTRFECYKNFNYILGGILLCLSCGIYQAYISFAMVLTLCYLLLDLLVVRRTIKLYLNWIARQMVMYICALAAYYIIWKIMMRFWGVTAYSYQGISGVGSLDIDTIFWAIPSAINSFFFFFAGELLHLQRPSMYEILGVCFLVLFFAILVVAILKSGLLRSRTHLALLILSLILIPFAAHIWYFTSREVEYDTRLLQSLSILFVFILALLEGINFTRLRTISFVLLLATVFNFGVQANICYFYMQRCYETTYGTAVEMLTRIHMVQNDETKYLVIVGELTDESVLGTGSGATTTREIRNLAGTLSKNLLFDYKLTYMFMWNNLGLTLGEIWDPDQQQLIAQMTEVKEMGNWPSMDSVRAIEDFVIVKLNDSNN